MLTESATVGGGDMRLGVCTSRWAVQTPEALAVRYSNRQWTWGEWNERLGQLAAGLRAAGVGRGARVAFLSRNTPIWLELILATARVGAATVVLNSRLTSAELDWALTDSAVSLICCGAEFRELVHDSAQRTGRSTPVITVGGSDDGFEALLSDHDPIGTQPDVHPDDVAVILHRPDVADAAAALTHRNLLSHSATALAGIDRIDGVLLATTQLSDASDIALALAGITAGVPTVVARQPDASALLEAITVNPGHLLVVPPILADAFAAGPQAIASFFRVRTLWHRAAPVPPDLMRRAQAVWRHLEFVRPHPNRPHATALTVR